MPLTNANPKKETGGGGGGGVCGKRLKDAWVRQSRRGTNVGAVAHMGFYKSY